MQLRWAYGHMARPVPGGQSRTDAGAQTMRMIATTHRAADIRLQSALMRGASRGPRPPPQRGPPRAAGGCGRPHMHGGRFIQRGVRRDGTGCSNGAAVPDARCSAMNSMSSMHACTRGAYLGRRRPPRCPLLRREGMNRAPHVPLRGSGSQRSTSLLDDAATLAMGGSHLRPSGAPRQDEGGVHSAAQ